MTPPIPATTERIAAREPGKGSPVARMIVRTPTRPAPSTTHSTTATGTRLLWRPPRKSATPQQLEAARESRTGTMRGHPARTAPGPAARWRDRDGARPGVHVLRALGSYFREVKSRSQLVEYSLTTP